MVPMAIHNHQIIISALQVTSSVHRILFCSQLTSLCLGNYGMPITYAQNPPQNILQYPPQPAAYYPYAAQGLANQSSIEAPSAGFAPNNIGYPSTIVPSYQQSQPVYPNAYAPPSSFPLLTPSSQSVSKTTASTVLQPNYQPNMLNTFNQPILQPTANAQQQMSFPSTSGQPNVQAGALLQPSTYSPYQPQPTASSSMLQPTAAPPMLTPTPAQHDKPALQMQAPMGALKEQVRLELLFGLFSLLDLLCFCELCLLFLLCACSKNELHRNQPAPS